MFLIFGIRDSPAADELRPVLVVVAFVNREIAETTCFSKRGGVNPELVTDEVDDADLGCGSLASCHFAFAFSAWRPADTPCISAGEPIRPPCRTHRDGMGGRTKNKPLGRPAFSSFSGRESLCVSSL